MGDDIMSEINAPASNVLADFMKGQPVTYYFGENQPISFQGHKR
jgi:hypothetical protein